MVLALGNSRPTYFPVVSFKLSSFTKGGGGMITDIDLDNFSFHFN